MISVIICTIRRPALVAGLLSQLDGQTYRDAEVLVVGGQDEEVKEAYAALGCEGSLPLRYAMAPRGLAAARNVGLREAQGSILCFLDDDVVIGADFLEKVAAFFADPAMERVGGMTAFDAANSSETGRPPLRWRLRYWLRITPSLEPGFCTHLGRSVPFSFLKPFSGVKDAGWLPGHCQVFRAEAIKGLRYDEDIIVEDRDFSLEVAARWRLVVCGDIRIEHRRDSEARHSHVRQTWRASFGLGRSYAKRQRTLLDKAAAAHVLVGEFLIDVGIALVRPTYDNFQIPWTRVSAFITGYRSVQHG